MKLPILKVLDKLVRGHVLQCNNAALQTPDDHRVATWWTVEHDATVQTEHVSPDVARRLIELNLVTRQGRDAASGATTWRLTERGRTVGETVTFLLMESFG